MVTFSPYFFTCVDYNLHLHLSVVCSSFLFFTVRCVMFISFFSSFSYLISLFIYLFLLFFFSSISRHTSCALFTGVQTCALPISFHLSQWLSRLLMERFEHRISAIYALLHQQRGSWEDTCYIWMARSFGFKVNSDAFEQLARSLPQSVIGKHKNNTLAVEALFFGQAGMLENEAFEDAYPQALQREYAHLRRLHSLQPMDALTWRFKRTQIGR